MTNIEQAPLAGLRVVELTGIGPAPFAALLLAELGADVVRVDRPGGGVDTQTGLGRSRPSLAVDLKHSRGIEVMKRLTDQADVFIEGLRPGVTERLGLGAKECLESNPRLVYGRMTGWGQDGPWAAMAGHDINYAAITGALHLSGGADRPRQPANIIADFGGGSLYLLVGILAALQARQRTGRGQVVDAAMVDGAASLVTMIYGMFNSGAWRDEREANLLDGGAPFYDTYKCADGTFVAVGAIEAPFYRQLLDGLELSFEDPQMDAAAWPRHREAIAGRFLERTREDWMAVFEGTDACVAPVLTLAEAPRHAHLVARGTFAELDGRPVPRVAPRFSDTPALDPSPSRPAGADTIDCLRRYGFDAHDIDELLACKAVYQS